jgi:hypothetical protein
VIYQQYPIIKNREANNMVTNGSIIEGLRARRTAGTVTIETPRHDPRLHSLHERTQRVLFRGKKTNASRAKSVRKIHERVLMHKETVEGEDSNYVLAMFGDGKYLGSVRDGVPHGHGTMFWNSGDIFEGFWYDNVPHGYGLYIWADGTYFIGTYNMGNRHGVGSYYEDGEVYSMKYENGVLVSAGSSIDEKTRRVKK